VRVHRTDVVVQLGFGLAECAQFSLIQWIELLLSYWLQIVTVLPSGRACTSGCMATGAEEGVVAQSTILQERVVECVHT
jgi:hypothetical protein